MTYSVDRLLAICPAGITTADFTPTLHKVEPVTRTGLMSIILKHRSYSTGVLLGSINPVQEVNILSERRLFVPRPQYQNAWERFFLGNVRKAGRAALKRIVPGRVIQEARRYLRVGKSQRALYLKLRITNCLGLKSRKVPPGARSFVFVCFGNIMRSPMSEALFKDAIARNPSIAAKITSAGLNATPGTPAHPWAVAAAQDFGISLEHHQSILLTREMVDEADAILAMDSQNQVELLSRYPDAADRFFLLGAYSGTTNRPIEIRDPFYGDLKETRRCYRLLQTCIKNLAESLDASKTQNKASPSVAR